MGESGVSWVVKASLFRVVVMSGILIDEVVLLDIKVSLWGLILGSVSWVSSRLVGYIQSKSMVSVCWSWVADFVCTCWLRVWVGWDNMGWSR